MVICDFDAAVGSGLKFSATTALGITETILGSSAARRTVFSLLGIGGASQHFLPQEGFLWMFLEDASLPSMADANDMIHVTESKFQ